MALCELGCSNLDSVYEMTWAEFMIRLYGWKRMQEAELYKMREMAWITYIAPHQDPKKMKKSKEAFWSLKKTNKAPNEEMKEAILKAQQEYLEEKKKKENG